MTTPLPRSIGTRRQLAAQLRRRLRDYSQAVGLEADPRAITTVVDAAALARLEGYDPDTIARAVARGLSGQLKETE